MNTPKSSRYAYGLLRNGKNNDYMIKSLERLTSVVDTIEVGYYFNISVTAMGPRITQVATGVTPLQAIIRCLEKHGETFR